MNHLILALGPGRKEHCGLPGITKMAIFPVGFPQPLSAPAAWVSGAGVSVRDTGPPSPGSPGQAASAADVNGFERRNEPLGICKTFVRKGKKKPPVV